MGDRPGQIISDDVQLTKLKEDLQEYMSALYDQYKPVTVNYSRF